MVMYPPECEVLEVDRPRGPTSPDETIGGGSFQTGACEPQIGVSARRLKAAYEGFERSVGYGGKVRLPMDVRQKGVLQSETYMKGNHREVV